MAKLTWSYEAGTLQVRQEDVLVFSWPVEATLGPWTALILNCLPLAGEAIVRELRRVP